MTEIVINGLGGIGRRIFPAVAKRARHGKEVAVVGVNDLVPVNNLARLLKYGSTEGGYGGIVRSERSDGLPVEDKTRDVDGHDIKRLAVDENPAAMPGNTG